MKVETSVTKISHKKRKDSSSPLVKVMLDFYISYNSGHICFPHNSSRLPAKYFASSLAKNYSKKLMK